MRERRYKLYDSVDVTMLKDAYWYSNIEELKLGDINLLSLDGLSVFMNLKILSLANNHIKEIKNLDNLRKLEMLNLHNNLISEISGLENLVMLQKIDLGKNFIKQIKNLHTLSCLTHLSLEHNRISSFGSIESVKSLMELYLYNNFLTQIKDIQILKSLTKLIILDISGNSMVQSTDYRLFVVYHLKKLKVLDGLPIDPNEQNSAREMYGGRLTEEILDKRLNGMHCNEIPILDLSEAKLKSFDNFVNAEIFCKLSELNLSGNHISSFNFISEMPRLTKLHLSRNRIDTLIAPKDRGLAVLNSLDTLDLSHNLLKDLNGLQMCALPTLRVLVLTGNQISKLEFVSHLSHLKELVLTGNKLRQVEPTSFTPSCGLRFLIIDDNGLRTLANIGRLVKLQCLQAANNRISDFSELDRLTDLPNLMELNLSGNSISRKNMYRLAVIKRITQLVFLDSQEVTPEERERVDGAPEQTPPLLVHINQPPLPKVPVKITSVNFDGLVMKAQEQIGRRPSSSNNLNGVLGVTPLSFTMKPKKPKK
jgi:Leucine-rich repeat (LRR) protein